MSLVYITYHDENIFDVDMPKTTTKRTSLKYTSKFSKMVKDESKKQRVVELPDKKKLLTSSVRNSHQTMGYAITPPANPSNFLKKNQGVKWQRLNEHVCPPKPPKQPLPFFKRTTTIVKEKDNFVTIVGNKKVLLVCPRTIYFKDHRHRGNFVRYNVKLADKLVAKRTSPKYVDSVVGDSHLVIDSGLVPHYICLKEYGKVPCYLTERKKMLNALKKREEEVKLQEEASCNRYVRKSAGLKKMSSKERNEILKGLRINYANSLKIFQSFSLCTDTAGKQLRKSTLEYQLRQLEQDIRFMEHEWDIFVSEY